MHISTSFYYIKAALFSSRHSGGETIPIVSSFAGCAQYTPPIGYVADPACGSSPGMIRLVTLVSGVDVSQRVAYYLVTIVTRGASRCYRVDRRAWF
jgi:hypothetical protein